MTKAQKWTALTAVAVLAIVAAGWLLLVSPKRSEAAELRSQRQSQDQQNELLRTQIARLVEQSKDLPEQQSTLKGIRRQLPANPALPELIRALNKAATSSGATLESLAPKTPEAVGAASPSAGSTAPATSAELVAIPVTITASGKFYEVEQLLNKLEELERAFLVTGFDVTNPEAEQGGTTLALTLEGRVFVAPSTDESATAGTAGSTSAGASATGTSPAAASAS